MPDTTETRDQKRERQVKEQFEALGRFVQAFEALVFSIRSRVRMLAPTPYNPVLIAIIVNHKALTAQAIWEILRAVMGELSRQSAIGDLDDSAFSSIIREIDTEFQALVKDRNSLLHGTWLIGYHAEDDTDYSKFKILNLNPSKSGLGSRADLPTTAEELDELSTRCKALSSKIEGLSFVLAGVVPFLARFEKVGARWVFK
ncbi:MAG: hypothetical protein R3D70_25450 [Rhizobiaceae bacterium]